MPPSLTYRTLRPDHVKLNNPALSHTSPGCCPNSLELSLNDIMLTSRANHSYHFRSFLPMTSGRSTELILE